MNTSIVRALAVSLSVAFSSSALAQSLSKAEYKSARDAIAADYKSERAACAAMTGDTKSSCYTEAKGKQKAARAELAARQKPAAAPSSNKEKAQVYVDDSVITAKVKTAVFEEASLKSAEINVETYKGIVQLSGFVRSRTDINKAVDVARRVKGVVSVKNDMIVKGQQ
jgi:hyperosmotically inducible protein